jgi:hypothetical protein
MRKIDVYPLVLGVVLHPAIQRNDCIERSVDAA